MRVGRQLHGEEKGGCMEEKERGKVKYGGGAGEGGVGLSNMSFAVSSRASPSRPDPSRPG